jgi:hypothetical protein
MFNQQIYAKLPALTVAKHLGNPIFDDFEHKYDHFQLYRRRKSFLQNFETHPNVWV